MIFQYELKDNSLRVMVPKELDHHSSIDLRSQTDMLLQTYHVKIWFLILKIRSLWTAPESA